MSGAILIRGLRVPCRIGVTEEERATPQTVVIDLEVEVDLATASRTDQLAATLDYDLLTEEVVNLVSEAEPRLLERLAGSIADVVLSHKVVRAVTVTVGKADPPVEAQVDSIDVRLRRERR